MDYMEITELSFFRNIPVNWTKNFWPTVKNKNYPLYGILTAYDISLWSFTAANLYKFLIPAGILYLQNIIDLQI